MPGATYPSSQLGFNSLWSVERSTEKSLDDDQSSSLQKWAHVMEELAFDSLQLAEQILDPVQGSLMETSCRVLSVHDNLWRTFEVHLKNGNTVPLREQLVSMF